MRHHKKNSHYYFKFYVNGNLSRTMGCGNLGNALDELAYRKFRINTFIVNEHREPDEIKHKWYVATLFKANSYNGRRMIRAIITLCNGTLEINYTHPSMPIPDGDTSRENTFHSVFTTPHNEWEWYKIRIDNVYQTLTTEMVDNIISRMKGLS